eukprot:TRINITY_DN32999_c0_g1_i1.p2 TRINITY_DN32999_c0_g1~~TRINITY_DN32999_c0_g1_i1.p2  ORF type:complete len:133 (-),score=3.46 TRINITY_DN32999_c0_g1_i1:123-521(-)
MYHLFCSVVGNKGLGMVYCICAGWHSTTAFLLHMGSPATHRRVNQDASTEGWCTCTPLFRALNSPHLHQLQKSEARDPVFRLCVFPPKFTSLSPVPTPIEQFFLSSKRFLIQLLQEATSFPLIVFLPVIVKT